MENRRTDSSRFAGSIQRFESQSLFQSLDPWGNVSTVDQSLRNHDIFSTTWEQFICFLLLLEESKPVRYLLPPKNMRQRKAPVIRSNAGCVSRGVLLSTATTCIHTTSPIPRIQTKPLWI